MDITFVTLGMAFNGNTIKERSLGGSESAHLQLARAFAGRGHKVRVYCECPTEGEFDNVVYYHHSKFSAMAPFINVDVLIVGRWPEFLPAPATTKWKVLWLHDMPTDKSRIMAGAWSCDEIYCLSEFHKAKYTEPAFLPEIKDYIWVTSNGIDMEACKKARKAATKTPKRLIFTSRPERGLLYLLEVVMPEIWKEDPEVVLEYAHYDLAGMQVPQEVTRCHKMCDQLTQQYGGKVKKLGNLTKDKLYEAMAAAQLLVYPTDFPEISCITAMEAQACGTPIVTSNAFALKETIEDGVGGVLIGGTPMTNPDYGRTFAATVLRILEDKEELKRLGQNGPMSVHRRGFTWEAVAEKWEARWREQLNARLDGREEDVVKHLIQMGDLIGAEFVARTLNVPPAKYNLAERIEAGKKRETFGSDAEVIGHFAECVAWWPKILELLKTHGLSPVKVLDYCPGDLSFGLFFKRILSGVDVTICEPDPVVRGRLERYIRDSKLADGIRVIEALPLEQTNGQYDFVWLGSFLDRAASPDMEIRFAQKLCREKGCVGWSNEFGYIDYRFPQVPTETQKADGASLEKIHHRVNNLTFIDFHGMLPNSVGLKAVFHYTKGADPYDPRARWIFVIPADQAVKPIDLGFRVFTRPYESVAACMIVGGPNSGDADYFRLCMRALRPYVDRIRIVFDARTPQQEQDDIFPYLARFEIESVTNPLDNFSNQRNISIGREPPISNPNFSWPLEERWLLWIDTDERLVGGDHIRRYLFGRIYEGFSIAQKHLMLDLQGSQDMPVRLLRNRPHYKFTGYIHEHCEDTKKGDFDEAVTPAMVLPDVELAHYGYINERLRRRKCSNRNMELLKRDLQDHPTRRLNKVLVMRDHLNIAKWAMEQGQQIQLGDERYTQLVAAINVFHQYFMDEDEKFFKLAFPMYQEALSLVGKAFLPLPGEPHPPFEIGVQLTGSVGGLQTTNIPLQRLWFANKEHFLKHIQRHSHILVRDMNIATKEEFKGIIGQRDLPQPYGIPTSVSPSQLQRGVGVVPNDARV